MQQAGALPHALLTGRGRDQAQHAAQTVAKYSAAAVYASTALRAQQTAAIVAARLSLPVVLVAGLEEVWLGRSEGATDVVTHQLTAGVLHAWIVDGDLGARVANGESGVRGFSDVP